MKAFKLQLTIALLLAIPQNAAAQVPSSGTVAITGATLIDGKGDAPLTDSAVLIVDGRILQVGPRGSVEIPEGARLINADGKYLLPGFIDAHAHLSLGPVQMDLSNGVPAMSLTVDPEIPIRSMRALLAHGVTSIRDPGGSPAQLIPLREGVAAGSLVGPRMRVAGMVIDKTPFEGLVNQVNNVEEVRAAVREDADAGVDMVKLYVELTPDLIGAAVDEAHARGVEAVAHLMKTSWTEAANLGLDHILHIFPGSESLLPKENRAEYRAMMKRGSQFMYGWFELVDFNGPEITEMIQALVTNEVSVDPTLVMFEAMVRGDDPFFTQNDALAIASPSLLKNWRAWFNFNTGWTADDYVSARRAWPKFLELAKRLHDAGVTLTAGTDANNPWIVPGHSFHRELELLCDAGIDPLEVIKIATHNGAKVMGILAETGTIEPGKWADLVLLTSNPLVDISNSREIEWVMQAGRSYRPEDLLAGIH